MSNGMQFKGYVCQASHFNSNYFQDRLGEQLILYSIFERAILLLQIF